MQAESSGKNIRKKVSRGLRGGAIASSWIESRSSLEDAKFCAFTVQEKILLDFPRYLYTLIPLYPQFLFLRGPYQHQGYYSKYHIGDPHRNDGRQTGFHRHGGRDLLEHDVAEAQSRSEERRVGKECRSRWS